MTVRVPYPDEDVWCMSWQAPTFGRQGNNLDRTGVHWLLSQAALPEAELLHMGATRAMLDSERSTPIAVRWVVPLLGRIAWDAIYGESGLAYHAQHRPRVMLMGAEVVGDWFS